MKIRPSSLVIKLSLAFLFVGLIGTLLVAVFVGWKTRQDFNLFIQDRDRFSLAEAFGQFYARNRGWSGIEDILSNTPSMSIRRGAQQVDLVLADADGTVLSGGDNHQVGDRLSLADRRFGVPIQVDGETVGWVLLEASNAAPPPGSPEAVFLERMRDAIIFGAVVAGAFALLLGILLARNISKPLSELTEATRLLARGKLGHQVQVHGQDELGELAESFNKMSVDLAMSNQLRRQMTADIAHDLRTPLSVVMGYAEALSEGKLQGTEEIYQVIHTETQHLQRLIDDLRTLSLADAGDLTLTRQILAPQVLLERAEAAHRAQAAEKGITILVEASDDLPKINVDPDRIISQVIGNLINNGLRYTPEGGRITLSANLQPVARAEDPKIVRISIQDTGTGISDEDLPNVFNRFYRGDKSRHETGESGLGLPIAKSIVELHGGEISVESTPGKGTRFLITLPGLDQ